jgi:hypothetical protein
MNNISALSIKWRMRLVSQNRNNSQFTFIAKKSEKHLEKMRRIKKLIVRKA